MRYYQSINDVQEFDSVKLLVQPHCYGTVKTINYKSGVIILSCPKPHGEVHVHFRNVIRTER